MTAFAAAWIDELGRQHSLAVAAELGLAVQKARGASGGSFACPACGAERRHPTRKDRRLAVGVRTDGHGWRCYQCDASGDQLHLVAIKLEGRRWNELHDDAKARVRAWVHDWLRLGGAAAPSTEAVLAQADGDRDVRIGDAEAPEYPPAAEVAALWAASGSVLTDGRVCSWLAGARALPVKSIASCDLARALPFGAPCPGWATKVLGEEKTDVPWSKSAYRAIFPLYDARGALRSVLARYVGTPQHENVPKSRAPLGYARRGLVLADGPGRDLLLGALSKHWGTRGVRPVRVVIAEGEMDMLAFAVGAPRIAATETSAAREIVCVLGIVSGSWTDEIAARIPDGATVLIATHADDQGEKYAKAITTSLLERMRARAVHAERWRAR